MKESTIYKLIKTYSFIAYIIAMIIPVFLLYINNGYINSDIGWIVVTATIAYYFHTPREDFGK